MRLIPKNFKRILCYFIDHVSIHADNNDISLKFAIKP